MHFVLPKSCWSSKTNKKRRKKKDKSCPHGAGSALFCVTDCEGGSLNLQNVHEAITEWLHRTNESQCGLAKPYN